MGAGVQGLLCAPDSPLIIPAQLHSCCAAYSQAPCWALQPRAALLAAGSSRLRALQSPVQLAGGKHLV